jgi:prepilin-type N-terminal cleavage/methylation domain-containing protein
VKSFCLHAHARARGLTLIELMIVVAVMAVLAVLAAPSFRDMILVQRLRAINAQLVTDLQFARSEAAQRKRPARLVFSSNASQSCYVIYTAQGNGQRCNCLLGPGAACTAAGTTEIRTVVVPTSLGVTLLPVANTVDAFGFSAITGGLISIPSDSVSTPLAAALLETRVDATRRLRTALNQSGRPSVCAPDAAAMQTTPCT